MSKIWNERYNSDQFIYGTEPNEFFKTVIETLKTGKILLPAEGEGRNAIYAAKLGWESVAFDGSKIAQEKALAYAKSSNTSVKYNLNTFEEINYQTNEFDCIALIFAHVEADNKKKYFRKLLKYLKPGGVLIFEGFCRSHSINQANNPSAGGPRDLDMLFTLNELEEIFNELNTIQLTENSIELKEGLGHIGEANVIRYIGKK